MEKKEYKGSITVFLSLTCILFLSLICAAVESARVQGAKAQTANIMGMGNFSVLGEFEKPLLDEYDVFALDGSYGNGSFKIQKVEDRLEEFISCNADPKKDVFSVWCFDPWNLELTGCEVSGYALLTDETGEPFYQQAVSYMKTNLPALAVDKLMEVAGDTDKVKEWQEEYEKRKRENDGQISGLEQEKQQKMEELESEAQESSTALVPTEEKSNPLKEIAKLRKKSTLEIVTGDRAISGKKIKTGSLPSRSRSRKGNLKLEKEHSGLTANVLFREYLLMHFPNYLSEEEGPLAYQLEYLLGGKGSDKDNLKYVVNRLLLIREGMNYLYCLQDGEMGMKAEGLAVTLTGFLGIPALTAATKHALLLAWAYGESLIDVRTLLNKGKVPLMKDALSWNLTLENLGRITEILDQGGGKSEKGLEYTDYLRILLNMGTLAKQKMRALDMIQENLRQNGESSKFKAENCIVAIKAKTGWNCKPVFFSLPSAVMGIRSATVEMEQEGSIMY